MTEILVIGANPTGLILATRLLEHGVVVKVIDHRLSPLEREQSSFDIPIILSPPSLELLNSCGLFNQEDFLGSSLCGMTYFWKQHSLNVNIDGYFKNHPLSAFPYFYVSNYSLFENYLIRKFEESGGSVQWATRPVTMVDSNLFIEKIDSGSTFEHREIHTPKYILACEADINPYIKDIMKHPGRVRKHPREISVFSCPFKQDLLKNQLNIFALSGCSNHLLFPDPEKKKFLLWMPSNKKKILKSQEKLFSFLEINNPEEKKIYKIHQTILPYRYENVLFIGNVFNSFFFSSKMGVNLNILSAFNLLWKLLPILKNESSEKLIASYEQEIASAYKLVSRLSKKHALIQAISSKLFPTMAYWGFRGYNFICSSKKQHAPFRFSINYSPSSITKQNPQNKDAPGPKPGEYAPDILIDKNDYLLDGISDSKHLLLFFKNHSGLVEALREEYGKWLNVKVVKSQIVKDLYKANENSLFIIRPDRYIGYRSLSFKTRELITYLLKIFPNMEEKHPSNEQGFNLTLP